MRLGRVGTALTWLVAIVLAGCSGPAGSTDSAEGADHSPAGPGPSTVTLTAAQRQIADQLVSVFQNGTPEPQYDYVEDLGDGRGFTCGKIGFTSTSTEVRDAVEAYRVASLEKVDIKLLRESAAPMIKARLDRDHDGVISWSERMHALQMARKRMGDDSPLSAGLFAKFAKGMLGF